MIAVDRARLVVVALGVAAALALLAAVAFRLAALVPLVLVGLGGAYAAFLLLGDGGLDAFAPLYAAGLFVVGELAYAAVGRQAGRIANAVVVARALVILALAVAAAAVASVVLVASQLDVGGGLVLEALGVAAAVATLALVAGVVRSWRRA